MRRLLLSLLCALSFSSSGYSDHYTLDARRETALLTGGAAVTALGLYFYSRVQPPDPASLDSQNIPFCDRPAVRFRSSSAARLSDGMLAVSLFLPFPSGLLHSHHRNADAVMAAESFLYTFGMTNLFKGIFHRARPYVYRTDVDVSSLSREAGVSFFSGHTSMAFQGAVLAGMIYQTYHPDSKGSRAVWITGLGCAGATGLLRVLSGNHFPTDVLAGAAVGAFMGGWIPQLHKAAEPDRMSSASSRSEFRMQFQFGF